MQATSFESTTPRKHVIHAVGPIYFSGDVETNAAQLRSCYKTSLEIAVQNDLQHIVRSQCDYTSTPLNSCASQAFPSLSTGIFGYPIRDATHIALDAARVFLDAPEGEKVHNPLLQCP